MVVPITDVVKMTLSVADISVELIIGTPLSSLTPIVTHPRLSGSLNRICIINVPDPILS